ncbi:hypothetical protein SLS62_003971 [Diatrype stigma]|uniref:FAD/NAD(P)-binding domain-containing protein n=1 Tax=Diatrype stigma TaxID=117547 RepID=A0AAN9US68_9PEZI
MAKTVVILGGAYAGIQVAHRLLKHTRSSVPDLKVILVSKLSPYEQNSHFYWNLASVRAIVPGLLEEAQYSQSIADGFKQYPAEAFELIVGSAEAVDVDARTVRVSSTPPTDTTTAAEPPRVLSYDHLVLATGTRDVDPAMPWKGSGTHEQVRDSVAAIQARVASARHIVVAGGGATGVEVAAELKCEFKGAKEVVLLAAGPALLGGDSLAGPARAELKKLGVAVRTGARVASSAARPDDGKTEVLLEGAEGEKIVTDLYLPTMGVVPNTEYLPEGLLTPAGYVDVDECFVVKGAKDVWAAGDVVSKPKGSFVLADMQAAGVAKNIDAALRGKAPAPVKTLPFDVFMCATGRSRGVGRMGAVKVFSLMVYLIKGKTLGVQRLPGWVDGSSF